MMNGNAKEAIQFYENALDAKVLFNQTFGEMPENPEFPLPEEAKELVSHAMLKVGETELMFSDIFQVKLVKLEIKLRFVFQLTTSKNQNKFLNPCSKTAK